MSPLIRFVARKREAMSEPKHVTWNRSTRALYGSGIVPIMDEEGVVKWGRM